MTDHLTTSERSKNMAAIKSKDTAPEFAVRFLAHRLGYRYRLHDPDLLGSPDLVFTSRKAVIFIHGCFWHQHSSARCKARPPKTNRGYWVKKLERNVARDACNQRILRRMGWRVMVIWECQTHDRQKVESRLKRFLENRWRLSK
jgi:DNA mismatch endonuclease (patch repair protein)